MYNFVYSYANIYKTLIGPHKYVYSYIYKLCKLFN